MTISDDEIIQGCRDVVPIFSRIGEKWAVVVIILLQKRSRRFNDLKRSIEGISQQMLTRTLRGLERDGLVSRTIIPSRPPRVDYSLTVLGFSLAAVFVEVRGWAKEYATQIDKARSSYDEREEQQL